MQRTIGLDFGTHQTKICVEEKEGVELNYSFIPFFDEKGDIHYVLPSIIRIDEYGYLNYGFQNSTQGILVRYFKQATFCPDIIFWDYEIKSKYFCVWYLAYIIFNLEDKYGQEFAIQMGAPTDSEHHEKQKETAVSILLEAFRLAEEEFSSLEEFLSCPIDELFKRTNKELKYDKDKKNELSIFILPEAFACLRPLTKSGKIPYGLNLMVDIGGGTTDVSFFNIDYKSKEPQIYHFFSIPKALNFLCKIDSAEQSITGDIHGHSHGTIKLDRLSEFKKDLAFHCKALRDTVLKEFETKITLEKNVVLQALKNRPLVYGGGGSKYEKLITAYEGFSDFRTINISDWSHKHVKDLDAVEDLCPILSTAYGLSIATTTDTIKYTPLKGIFDSLPDEYQKNKVKKELENNIFVYKCAIDYAKERELKEEERKRQSLESSKYERKSQTVSMDEIDEVMLQARLLIRNIETFKSKRPVSTGEYHEYSLPSRKKIFIFNKIKKTSKYRPSVTIDSFGKNRKPSMPGIMIINDLGSMHSFFSMRKDFQPVTKGERHNVYARMLDKKLYNCFVQACKEYNKNKKVDVYEIARKQGYKGHA